MRIKKFIAESLREGKSRIIRELGEDAIVLSSRTIKDPKDENNSLVEIVAAVDNQPAKPSAPKLPISNDLRSRQVRKEEINKAPVPSEAFIDDLESMKEMLKEISESVRYKNSNILSPVYDKIYRRLIDAGFTDERSLSIAGDLSSDENIDTMEEAMRKARYLITRKIELLPPLEKGDSCQNIILFGPTGTGKTLTLVKLSIVSKLVLEADTLIISADMHKVGGAEQLETYASIAGIPFKAVYSAEELQKVVTNESYRDIILIDTTGRSPNNKTGMDELQDLCESVVITNKFLVQSATVSNSTYKNSIEKYSKLKPDAIVLTKLDEAETIGGILEAMDDIKLPLAYITTGQQIPDDIEPAGKEILNKFVLPDSLDEQ